MYHQHFGHKNKSKHLQSFLPLPTRHCHKLSSYSVAFYFSSTFNSKASIFLASLWFAVVWAEAVWTRGRGVAVTGREGQRVLRHMKEGLRHLGALMTERAPCFDWRALLICMTKGRLLGPALETERVCPCKLYVCFETPLHVVSAAGGISLQKSTSKSKSSAFGNSISEVHQRQVKIGHIVQRDGTMK